MIKAEIILDTKSPAGKTITTMELTYPRFIHAELMTHRVFSRNAASSRAIPIKKMVAAVIHNPAMPMKWGSNKAGMQAGADLSPFRRFLCRQVWLKTRYLAIAAVWVMYLLGLHKQVANRLLEPWMHMTVVVTATEWENFFCLRAHKDAQPEFQVLAYRMLYAFINSVPCNAAVHCPYASTEQIMDSFLHDAPRLTEQEAIIRSVASCARVSYTNQGVTKTAEEDRKLHDRLLSGGHMSPFEHVAFALDNPNERSGNFIGWKQYRKTLAGEVRTATMNDLKKILAERPLWVTLRD